MLSLLVTSVAIAVGATVADANKPDDSRHEIIENVVGSSTDSQRALVADDELSDSDYERATMNALECMRSKGIVVKDVEPLNADTGTIGYSAFVPMSLRNGEQLMDDCDREFAADIRAAWHLIHELDAEGGE